MGCRRGWSITVEAPASIANLGPGLDVLSLAIKAFRDRVSLTICEDSSEINVFSNGGVPHGKHNVAYRVVEKALEIHGYHDVGVSVRVEKGVPVSAGLGGSGSTSAATSLAIESFFSSDPSLRNLLLLAGEGEKMIAGAPHYDNVAASLLGGVVIVDPVEPMAYRLEAYPLLTIGVLIPSLDLRRNFYDGKTRKLRRALPGNIGLETHVRQVSLVAVILKAFYDGDLRLLGKAVSIDLIAEKVRSRFIPGYQQLKEIALRNGAYGFNISGSGPSIFFLHENPKSVEYICGVLVDKWSEIGVESNCFSTGIDREGARVVEGV